MKWTVGTKIGSGFGLGLAILVMVGGVSRYSAATLTDTAAWVAHTEKVLEGLESVLSDMKDAETGQRGYLLTGDASYLEPYLASRTAIHRDLATLRTLTRDNANQQRRLDLLEPLIDGKDGKFAELEETIDARKDPAHGFDAALRIVRTDKGKRIMDDLRRVAGQMQDEERALLTVRSEDAQATARTAALIILVGTATAVVLLSLAAVFITRNIAQPLAVLSETAERIAMGDLSVAVATTTRQDEVGVLMRTFARMSESLRAIAGHASLIAVGDLRGHLEPKSERDVLGNAFALMIENLRALTSDIMNGVNVLGASASEIVASTTQLAATASESAAAVSETTTTVEEVRQTAQLASQKARILTDSAQKATESSASGRRSTEDVAAGMQRIRQQMDGIAASMGRLSEQSQAIGQIIATVEDLASQSNLLAVNAAIKAAEAGEHGKGFGVVALEVRSLAEQSRQATSQVRALLGEIQKATTAAALATEQGSKAVDAGIRQTEVADESIRALAVIVSESAQAATQIAASSQQQLVGVDQVSGAMESIKQATSQNVASARQLEMAAHSLSDLGQRLRQMVLRYKLESGSPA